MPIAAIEATRHQRDRSLPAVARSRGSQPVRLMATSAAKATANQGSSGGYFASAAKRERDTVTANTITGSSMATRISLMTVAVSPVSFDML